MILPDFVLPSRVNQCWEYSGIDSPEDCLGKTHFEQYPHKVLYQYNSRGFRDQEWPDSMEELTNAIWCVGDSFTVGLGSPVEHTWPWILQKQTNQRTINVSMDGASNDWIARKTVDILQKINPTHLVIHWSYISRREVDLETIQDQQWHSFYQAIRETSWPNCERTQYNQLPEHILTEIENLHSGWNYSPVPDDHRIMRHIKCTDQDDVTNTLSSIHMVNDFSDRCKIIHSFIPKFEPEHLKGTIESQCQGLVVPEFTVLDLARDGHHYDRLTSQFFVDQLVPLLK